MTTDFNLSEYLKDLETIVNQDSPSTFPGGVAGVAGFFEKKYAAMGWSVKKHEFDPAVGPCLEIKNRESDKHDLLLIGHMDTVFPQGTASERPYSVKGDRAFGPGVADMKSGLLTMYYALKQLDEEGALDGKTVCVAQNSDEEISSAYSRPWLEELSKKSRMVLILEGARSEGVLVNQRKGVGRFTIDFKGKAAHSGVDPENGRSAIGEMGHWIVALHALTDYDVGTTVNVGVVSGGSVPNMVADGAQARVDMRFREMAEAGRVEQAVKSLGENPKIEGVRAEITGGVTRPPMNPSEKTLEICSRVDAIGNEVGMRVKWVGTGGGSDGNFSAALGIPTLDGLGPAGGRYHSAEEYLEVDTIEPHHRLLKEMIRRL